MSANHDFRLLRTAVFARGALVVFALGSMFAGGFALAAGDGSQDAEILERIKPVGQVNVAKAAAPATAPAPAAAPAQAAAPASPMQAATEMMGAAAAKVADTVQQATEQVVQAVAPATPAVDRKAMAQAKGCLGCHQVEMKVVGPAYKDVAAKYKGDAGALDRLAAKVQSGGVGVWGQIPMPPNNVTEDEAKTLVSWILSL